MKLFHKKKKHHEHNKPDKEEIEKQFENLLDELAIPNGIKREEMQNWDLGRKWMLLSQKDSDKTKRAHRSVSSRSLMNDDNPQYYINVLKSTHPEKCLPSLKVVLTGIGLRWVIEFLGLNGLDCILEILKEAIISTPKTAQKTSEIQDCIACIKALLNFQVGMNKCMERCQFTNTIVAVLQCSDELLKSADKDTWEKILCSALNILAALCLVPPHGHRLVISAFNNFSKRDNNEGRFTIILKCVWNCVMNSKSNVAITENYYSLLLSCITLVNMIINVPYELRVRCTLRSEFYSIGIENILQEMRGIKDDYIQTQLDTFYSTSDEDTTDLFDDKIHGNYNLDSQLRQISLAYSRHASIQKALASIVNNIHYLTTKYATIPNTTNELVFRELEHESHQLVLRHFFAPNHDTEEWVHIHAISDPHNKTIAVLPWMPNNVRTRRNTMLAAQKIASLSGDNDMELSASPHLGLPPDLPIDFDDIPPFSLSLSPISLPSFPSSSSLLPSPSSLLPSPHSPSSLSLDSLPQPPSLPTSPAYTDHATGIPALSPRPIPFPPPFATLIQEANSSISNSSNSSNSLESKSDLSNLLNTETISGEDNSLSSTPPPPPNRSIIPPPPPPSLPAKKSAATQMLPAVKMKNLQWKKVNEAKLQNTIWGQPDLKNSNNLYSATDFKLIEDLFGETAKATPRLNLLVANDNGTDNKKATKVTLIDSKRSNNIAIMLSKIRIKISEIPAAVEAMDSNSLTSEQLGQMLKLLPTQEEMTILNEYPVADRVNLGKPELYLLEVMAIPQFSSKLECWYFNTTFETKATDIKLGILSLGNASRQLMQSKKFSQLLLLILQLGNYINAGGFRGAASGIKLDCLNKLKELKAGDKRQTLLHFLVNFCMSKHPDLLAFFQDITYIEEAKNVPIQALHADFALLTKGMSTIENYLKDNPSGSFTDKLLEFFKYTQPTYEYVKKELAVTQITFEKVLSYFGEDPTSPEEFFGNIYRFHLSFQQVVTEIHKFTQLQNQQLQKQQKQKEQEENESAKPKPTITREPSQSGGQFLDSILSKMHNDPKIFRDRNNIQALMLSKR